MSLLIKNSESINHSKIDLNEHESYNEIYNEEGKSNNEISIKHDEEEKHISGEYDFDNNDDNDDKYQEELLLDQTISKSDINKQEDFVKEEVLIMNQESNLNEKASCLDRDHHNESDQDAGEDDSEYNFHEIQNVEDKNLSQIQAEEMLISQNSISNQIKENDTNEYNEKDIIDNSLKDSLSKKKWK